MKIPQSFQFKFQKLQAQTATLQVKSLEYHSASLKEIFLAEILIMD